MGTSASIKEQSFKEDVLPSSEEKVGDANGPKLGLTNFGNTCYINSIVQLLSLAPEFSNLLYASVEYKRFH